jgi:hypothetical protein
MQAEPNIASVKVPGSGIVAVVAILGDHFLGDCRPVGGVVREEDVLFEASRRYRVGLRRFGMKTVAWTYRSPRRCCAGPDRDSPYPGPFLLLIIAQGSGCSGAEESRADTHRRRANPHQSCHHTRATA